MAKKKIYVFVMALVLLMLCGCTNQGLANGPKAEGGVLDLTQTQLGQAVIKLDGEWEFFFNQLLFPGETDNGELTGYVQLPSSWNKAEGNDSNTGFGYATYRLRLLTPEMTGLALKIPRLSTAYKLFINGEVTAEAGELGTSRETVTPQYLPMIALFDFVQGENEIVIQVSNFHHRSGGILESIKLGGEKQILRLRSENLGKELFAFGSLISFGLYSIAFFLFRKKNRSTLYFALFCLLVGIRTLLVGEQYFDYLFPGFSWEIEHKIKTLTFYLGVPLILMFFRSIYPRYFHVRLIKVALIIGAIFGALVVATPARVFTPFNPAYQIWSAFCILAAMAGLFRLTVHKQKGCLFTAIGALILLITSANDIIFHSVWVNDSSHAIIKAIFRTGNLSSIGQVVFALANSLVLAKRFSDSLSNEENLTAELTRINSNLDELIRSRTQGLEESNDLIESQKSELEKANQTLEMLSYTDPLTGLWNRRKYAQSLETEWRRSQRYGRPISLIIMDIDYFKEFNDFNGHIAGDECLVKIGELLRQSLSRATDMAARYGGDEFVVLLTDSGEEEAMKVAEMLRLKIVSLKIPHGKSKVSDTVTVSMGVTSVTPDQDSSHWEFFDTADRALYKGKAAGRNQIKFLPGGREEIEQSEMK